MICHPGVDEKIRACDHGVMESNPRGDTVASNGGLGADWVRVLAHRQRDGQQMLAAVVERFRGAGVTPADVESHLRDGGDRLYAAARSGRDGWADEFGGPRAVAVLSAEVGALMSHLVARAASVRSVCVDDLLDEFSAVTVAAAIGVARQKVYELARPEIDEDYVAQSPWRSE